MDLRQLECFMAVCKELHFTRAAEKLHMSQPSLSQQIKNLEFEMGMPLFDRVGKKTALTEAGKILLKHSQRVFHELDQARAAIRDLNGLQRGSLTVGSLITCANYLLPPAILNFKQLYPNVELTVLGLRMGDIVKGLLENELDLGVAFLPVDNEDIDAISLFTEELSLAVPVNHPLTRLKTVQMTSLVDESFILLPENYFLRQLIDQYFTDLDMSITPTLELTTMESIVQMVAEGIGVTILPKPYLDFLENDQLTTVQLIEPTPTREVGFVFRKDKFMCTTTRTFMEQVREKSLSISSIKKQEAYE